MIGVALVGVLASVALPAYIQYVRRAKAAEVPVMTKEIATAEINFFLRPRLSPATGEIMPPCFLQVGMNPSAVTANRRPWEDTDTRWAVLGTAPSSPIYYSYFVTGDVDADEGICSTPLQAGMANPVPGASYAMVGAVGDLDGDGVLDALASALGMTTYAVVGPSSITVAGIPLTDGPDIYDTRSLFVMTLFVSEGGSPGVRGIVEYSNPDYY
jgi:hypothetical protein